MIPWIRFQTILPEDEELANQLSYPYYFPGALADSDGITPIVKSRKLETGDKDIILQSVAATITQGTPKSLLFLGGTTGYTVTTGKTAKLILLLSSNSTQAQFKVWESSIVDTAAGIAKYTYSALQFGSLSLLTVCPEWDVTEKTFAAGKYITIEVTTAGDAVKVLSAAVIES